MEDQVFAYVPHSRQKKFEDMGWEYECDLGYPHAAYASLYKWIGEGEPVYPENDIVVVKPQLKKESQE